MERIGLIKLAIVILSLYSGCSSSKLLSINDASGFKSKKNYLAIKEHSNYYELHNYKFIDGYLEGDLTYKMGFSNYNLVLVEVVQKLDFKGTTSIYIRIPYENIKKITYKKPDAGLTIVFLACIPLAAYALFYGGYILLYLIYAGP